MYIKSSLHLENFESAFPLLSTVLLFRCPSLYAQCSYIRLLDAIPPLRCIFCTLAWPRAYILWLPAASHWYFSPWIVAMTLRVCLAARNSRYQMPCHVPVACAASVSVVPAWRVGGGGGLFGETHELAVLDGDGDARADQRGLDVSLHKHTHVSNLSSPPEPRSTGKHPPACRPSPQHHAYTAPRPWAPRTARPSRARPSCRGGRPRPSSR